ncbi:hypothetical protein ABHD31_22935 [Enterobacter cloacae]|uniref:hypothetical protein n=1 Tax=Enterobacter cloacae TaxID=550 RepID=UPI00325A4AAA|nr:hypothetical protein [Enterobacter cloacae]HBB9956580.1 hypothetical protein [Enterobacter cloacae]
MTKESNAIEIRPVIKSNSLVMVAADAALSAVNDVLGSLRQEDRYQYVKLAKAALNSAKAALGED